MGNRIVICPYCKKQAEYVRGDRLYSGRGSWDNKFFWACFDCRAWVGCHTRSRKYHREGDEPLGRLANFDLRRAKMQAHMAFDFMWKSGKMKRKEAYRWLSGQLGIEFRDCHIGMFDLDMCNKVVDIMCDYEFDGVK